MDLFEKDKNLNLKPVRALGDFLKASFASGECSCARCRESGGKQDGYPSLHTFEIGGEVLNRLFGTTTFSDVRGVFSKAWEAYYKTPMPEVGPADMDAITVLVRDPAVVRLSPLLYAAKVVGDVGGVPHFLQGD